MFTLFHRTAIPLVLCAWLALGSASATAAEAPDYPPCDHKPSKAEEEGAKGAHKAAKVFFSKGRYNRAIASWIDAYNIDCTAHLLLINIGNAYEKLGNAALAIHAFETYAQRMGKRADSNIIEKIANLKELLKRKAENARIASNNNETDENQGPDQPPTSNGDRQPNIGPWLVMGGGGAAVVAGSILVALGNGKISDANGMCNRLGEDPATGKVVCSSEAEALEATTLTSEGEKFNLAGGVILGVGGLAIVGGLTWYLLDPAENADGPSATQARNWSLKPAVSLSYGGLSLSGRF